MDEVFALIDELLTQIPSWAQAGIAVADIISKISSVLSANAAPDDPTWQDLDARCTAARQQFEADAAPPPAAA